MEITNDKSDGVEIIRKIHYWMFSKKDSTVDITYLGAPKYRLINNLRRISKLLKNYLKPVISQKFSHNIEKKKGSFKFTREESKKTREN